MMVMMIIIMALDLGDAHASRHRGLHGTATRVARARVQSRALAKSLVSIDIRTL